jgi:phosphatidylinositol glycan class B
MSTSIRRIFFFSAALSALLYLLAATQSLPYLHPDEHFQIVEFASYKMGITHPDELAWEFAAQIRPAFQPFLCYGLFNFFSFIGIHDHYTHLLLLKLLTALMSVSAVSLFCYANLYLFEQRFQRYYILATFLFWTPYFFGAHFSSEAWSGIFTLLALSLIQLQYSRTSDKKDNFPFFGIGILLGFAFICRFQTAFFTLGILAWLLFVKRESIRQLFIILSGILIVICMGTLIDHWFYGQWVFTPWAYFESAFIHTSKNFGTQPFYMYLLWLLLFLSPPIGVIVLASMGLILTQQPRNLYVWVLLPFLFIHSVIGHKELRFLYPIMNLLPVTVVLAYQYLATTYSFSLPRWGKALKASAIGLVLFFNTAFLLILVLLIHYVGFDPKIFAYDIHPMANQAPIDIYYTDGNAHPFILPKATIDKDIYPVYLREQNIRDIKVSTWTQLDSVNSDHISLIAITKYEQEHDSVLNSKLQNYKILNRTSPKWLADLKLPSAPREALDQNIYLLYIRK